MKIWASIKTFFWAISLVFVYPVAYLKYLFLNKKARKYKKYHFDYLPEEKYTKVYKLAKIARYITRSKIKTFTDREKVLNKRQLIICNHRSVLDPILLFIMLYEQIGGNFIFVAKKELKDSKLGLILDFIDTIYIDRNNLREAIKVIDEQKEAIKKGKSVIVFPEGTRNDTDELLEFKSGAFEVAYKTICDIQPIILTNTNQYYEQKKQFRKKRQPIEVAIMPDIKASNFISINRTIFAKNIQKSMQHKYNQMIKNQKLDATKDK